MRSLRSSVFVLMRLPTERSCDTRNVEVALNPESRCRYWLRLRSKNIRSVSYFKRLGFYLNRSGRNAIKDTLVSVAEFQFHFSTGSTWDDNFSPPISSRLQLWQLAAESSPAHRRLCVSVWMSVCAVAIWLFVILISGCSFLWVITWKSNGAVSSPCLLVVTWFDCRASCRARPVQSSVMIYIYIYVLKRLFKSYLWRKRISIKMCICAGLVFYSCYL